MLKSVFSFLLELGKIPLVFLVFGLIVIPPLRYLDSEAAASAKYSQEFFQGTHELRRLAEYTDKHGELRGDFFLIAGSISGEYKEDQRVKFAWKTNDGSYAISSILLTHVRVKFDNVSTPHVQFALNCPNDGEVSPCGGDYIKNGSDQQKVIDDGYVSYITIACQPKDWPIKIQMPIS